MRKGAARGRRPPTAGSLLRWCGGVRLITVLRASLLLAAISPLVYLGYMAPMRREAAKRLTLQQALLAELQYTTKADVVSLDGMEEEYEPQDVEEPPPKPREKRRLTPAGGPVESKKAKAEPRRSGVAEGGVGGGAASERQQWASERAGVQEGARVAPEEGSVAAVFAQANLAQEEDVVRQDGASVRIRTEGASALEGEVERRAAGMAAAIQRARPATAEAATTTEEVAREGWFDIMQFGAVGDGVHNDTEAMVRALDASAANGGGTVHLPAGRQYLMWPFEITHSHVHVRIDGAIVCPMRLALWGALQILPLMQTRMAAVGLEGGGSIRVVSAAGDKKGRKVAAGNSEDKGVVGVAAAGTSEVSRELQRMRLHFIALLDVTNVTISGGGLIDGRGQAWWHLRRQRADVLAPVLLKLVGCTDVAIRDIKLLNSPFYHLVSVNTRRLTLNGLFIHAPLDSKNTDGISLMNSSDVTVRGCTVDTGDDNCAVKEGCRNVLVEDCDFRNGHGSSIGSIGEGGSYGEVQDVTMRNIVFNATVNAARVKTWQGGAGVIRNITYEKLSLIDVTCPILIEQFYCASSQHPGKCANSTRAVQISHVAFRDIRGTQTSSAVGQFLCADAAPCRDIVLEDIYVQPAHRRTGWDSSGNKAKAWWERPKGLPNNVFKCWNARGTQSRVQPDACLNKNSIGHGLVTSGVLSRGESIGLTSSDNFGLKKEGGESGGGAKASKTMGKGKKKTTSASCNLFTTVGCSS